MTPMPVCATIPEVVRFLADSNISGNRLMMTKSKTHRGANLMHSSRKFTSSVLFVVTIAIVVALFGETRSWASTHYGGGGYADINEGTCNRSTTGSEVLGGALGAIIGGLLGSKVGEGKGKLAATAIGVLVGALAGSAISKNMDQADNDCISKTLDSAPDKQAVAWRNPDAGADYRVTPLRTYRMAGNQCREFITKAVIGGRTQQEHGTTCRQSNGSWKLVENVASRAPPTGRAPPVPMERRASPAAPPPLTEEERERRKIIESLTYRLETKINCSGEPTWNDKGSGADLDGFFFDPNVPASYFPIGGYGSQNRAGRHCVTVVHDSPNNPKSAPRLLALPTGWELVWKDKGSGADLDGSMWQPVPPSKEYICIGSVSQIGYTRPTVPHYRCVHKSLVEKVSLTTVIWSDIGSGADKEVTIFKLPVSGSFVAVQGRRDSVTRFDLRRDTAIGPPREVVETRLSERMAFIRKERKALSERRAARAREQAAKRARPPPAPTPPAQQPLTGTSDTQPPVIDVPATVAAKGAVATIGGRIKDASRLIEVTIDGRPVAVDADGSFSARRGMPQGTSTITIAAMDEWGNRATRKVTVTRETVAALSPAPVKPMATPKPTPNPFAGIHFGAYHALVIGNNDYRELPKLKTAAADAKSVAKLLSNDYGFDTKLLLDATRTDIFTELGRLRAKLTPDDNLLIYYAGHGVLDEIGQQGYWLPVDAQPDIRANWVSNGDITTSLLAIRAKHVMVVADSCYSDTLVRAAPVEIKTSVARKTWVSRMTKKRARTALVSGGLEPVTDQGSGGHSVFANAILAALRANPDVMSGQVLYDAIKRPVVLNSDQTPQYSDIRKSGHEGGDFLFVKKGS